MTYLTYDGEMTDFIDQFGASFDSPVKSVIN